MTRQGEAEKAAPRYMTLVEVARELGLSRTAIYNKIYSGEMVGVDVGTGRSQMRVTRKSFEDYCDRLERKAAQRFGAA